MIDERPFLRQQWIPFNDLNSISVEFLNNRNVDIAINYVIEQFSNLKFSQQKKREREKFVEGDAEIANNRILDDEEILRQFEDDQEGDEKEKLIEIERV